jgi:orotate phosphoribosyltransferase
VSEEVKVPEFQGYRKFTLSLFHSVTYSLIHSGPLTISLMPTQTHAQQLLSLLARLSFRLGQFTLSSGGTSDYYIDCRTTTLHAEGGRLTGHAILELLEEKGIDADAVGGLTMGADPIVSNVATASAWRAQKQPGAPLIHGFLVRKAEKAHGAKRRIEGFCKEDARVVIVDDVCTTGASTINAIEAAQEAGMKVAAVVCIVEREEANGRPAVEAAAKGAPFLRLFTAKDVRAEHVKQIRVAADKHKKDGPD